MSNPKRSSKVLSTGGRQQVAGGKGKPATPSGAAGVKPSARAQSQAALAAQKQSAEAASASATVANVVASNKAAQQQQQQQPQQQQQAQPQQSQSQSQAPESPQRNGGGEALVSTYDFSRKPPRPDPADMRAAGVAFNSNKTKFNESLGVVATMSGGNAPKKTAVSVSRETYKVLNGKPSEPFKPRTSSMKDPIAHTDATINNPNFSNEERAKLEHERLRSESSRYFVDHYKHHADQVQAGRAVRPAAILASQQLRTSGPFVGTTVSQDAFVPFKNEDGTAFQPAKPFKPPPPKLELVKDDRDFQSEQRKQQTKTIELAQTAGTQNVLVKNSVSLKNFRGTGAAAAMGFGSSGMSDIKTVSQAAFSKFTKQQQINAKAREPTTVSSPAPAAPAVKQVQHLKAQAAPHARDTTQGANTEFSHVAHREDAPIGSSSSSSSSSSSAAAASTIQSPPRAGVSSARGKAIDAGVAAPTTGSRGHVNHTASKAGYNIISSLNANEQKKWSQNNREASTAQSSFVHDPTAQASKSFKPANANASNAAVMNGGASAENGSSQWSSEGHNAYAGAQNPTGTGVAARGKSVAQQSSGGYVPTPFEGRSTAADSYGTRPKASPKKK